MNRLGRVILREALHFPTMPAAALPRQEAQGPMPGSREFPVRLGKRESPLPQGLLNCSDQSHHLTINPWRACHFTRVRSHDTLRKPAFTGRPLKFPTPNQNMTISTEFLSARQKVHHLWLLGIRKTHFPFAESGPKIVNSHNNSRFS